MEVRVRQVFADVLRINAARISQDTSRNNCPEWDSQNHISLIMALEDEFGVSFEVEQIEAMQTFADVLAALRALFSAGSSIAMSKAMIPMTTSSSTKVNACRRRGVSVDFISCSACFPGLEM